MKSVWSVTHRMNNVPSETPHPVVEEVAGKLVKPVLMLVSLLFGAVSLAAIQPNIILIMADDLGYECVGANGDADYSTPHSDRLAATGMHFEHCYSQPLCTPSRVKIMTGISNVRNYITFGVLDPKATTFGNVMKSAGYTTAIAGKWQLGTDPAQLGKFGFDEYCLWQLEKKGSRYNNLGSLQLHTRQPLSGGYGPDKLNGFVLDFVERHQDGPFFLYYPMLLPHAPFEPTPDSKTRDGTEHENFADMVAYMDKMVGKVVAKLEASEAKPKHNDRHVPISLILTLKSYRTTLGFQGRYD